MWNFSRFWHKDYQKAISQSKLLTHRGPDESDHVILDHLPAGGILCHERLSIIDLHTGRQPIQGSGEKTWMIHNGEIYNHEHLRKNSQRDKFQEPKVTLKLLFIYLRSLGQNQSTI